MHPRDDWLHEVLKCVSGLVAVVQQAPSDQWAVNIHQNSGRVMAQHHQSGTIEEMDDCVWLIAEATASMMNASFQTAKDSITQISPEGRN
jgi:hypothetical protein